MPPERLAELFAAVHELLLEVGYERLTLDGVAARAHASKATLYRQWGSKSGLVMAALTFAGTKHQPLLGAPDAASLDEAFTQLPGTDQVTDRNLRMGFMLLQAASNDPEFATTLRREIIAPLVDELAGIFETAADRGEIVRDSALFRRLAYLILTDLAFFPLLTGEDDDQAAHGDLFRRVIRPALTFTDHGDTARGLSQ
jgi:AcrR family transcriptional regulator